MGKFNNKIVIISASVFVFLIIITCLAIFNPTVHNFFVSNASSQKSYLQKSEMKFLSEKSDSITKKVSDFSNKFIGQDGQTFDISSEITLTDPVKTVIKDIFNNDTKDSNNSSILSKLLTSQIENVKSIKLNSIVGVSKDECCLSLDLNMNSNDIIKASTILNIKDGIIYAQIPTISKDWLSFKLPKLDELATIVSQNTKSSSDNKNIDKTNIANLDKDAILSLSCSALKSLTNGDLVSKEDLENLLKTYTKEIFDKLEDVDKSSDEINIGKTTKKCNVYTCDISKDNLKKIIETILETAKNDKTTEKILISLGIVSDSKGYQNLVENLEKSSKDADTIPFIASNLKFNAWIDQEGNVIGNELNNNNVSIGFKTINDDSNSFTIYLSNGELLTIELASENKENNGSYSGNTSLTIKSRALSNANISLDIEYEDLKFEDNGMASGKINISSEKLFNIDCSMELSTSNDTQNIKSSIKLLKKELANMSATIKISKYTKANIPTTTKELKPNDSSSLSSYLSTVNIKNVTNNLKKSINTKSFSTLLDAAMLLSPYGNLDGKQSNKDVTEVVNKLLNKTDSNETNNDSPKVNSSIVNNTTSLLNKLFDK